MIPRLVLEVRTAALINPVMTVRLLHTAEKSVSTLLNLDNYANTVSSVYVARCLSWDQVYSVGRLGKVEKCKLL